jgi:hypothetical protein
MDKSRATLREIVLANESAIGRLQRDVQEIRDRCETCVDHHSERCLLSQCGEHVPAKHPVCSNYNPTTVLDESDAICKLTRERDALRSALRDLYELASLGGSTSSAMNAAINRAREVLESR